jgi:hypothetical protein
VIAWQFWNAPSGEARLLRRLQVRRCGETGGRLWKSAEVDHHVPLFRVWGEFRDSPWPQLLDYWGLPNLQVINRNAHAAKCATEARERHAVRCRPSELTRPYERAEAFHLRIRCNSLQQVRGRHEDETDHRDSLGGN